MTEPADPTLTDVLAGMPGTRELLAPIEVERDAALAAVERVKALHASTRIQLTLNVSVDSLCHGCRQPWPCPTIQALEQP